MIIASYARTMAGARQIVPDEGFRRLTPRRDRLNALSREWEARRQARADAEREARELAKEQAAAEIARWKRKHRRTRFIVKEVRTPHGEMIARVAAWHGFTAEDILDTNKRMKPLVLARRDAIEAVWRNCLLEMMKPTLLSMGRAFNSDHTSILYALKKRGLS
jgi:chromosomal replication initiation ATPase DnaA